MAEQPRHSPVRKATSQAWFENSLIDGILGPSTSSGRASWRQRSTRISDLAAPGLVSRRSDQTICWKFGRIAAEMKRDAYMAIAAMPGHV
jgi:hypothetical protein